ncbi:MAG: TIGR01212 family radical SAM protein [Lachnospiraceae bacterium]|nr:TIGR01212 family radical SAM protein [Lachnospiraceae bacterium]
MNHEHFYSANNYYKKTYGEKVYRLAIDGGMTCPNRDGRVGYGGCTFCSEKGSGDFTPSCGSSTLSVYEQLEKAKQLVSAKSGRLYIAYFQSYTNTYAPTDYLRKIFSEAMECPDIVALSIATRPDCIDPEVIELLTELKDRYQKDIYIELGLQTINDSVATAFNRGYSYVTFLKALDLLNRADIPVIVHMILGLPAETPADIYKSVSTVSSLNIHGIKLSLLHIIKGTAMEQEYLEFPERFHIMYKQTYIKTLCHCIELIPRNVVIYRITGDAPKKLLVAPKFTADKKDVLNSINLYMRENNISQGRLFHK